MKYIAITSFHLNMLLLCSTRETCDVNADYLCAVAANSGDYDNCSFAIDTFPDIWGMCEVRDCEDLDKINIQKEMAPSERERVCNRNIIINHSSLILQQKLI